MAKFVWVRIEEERRYGGIKKKLLINERVRGTIVNISATNKQKKLIIWYSDVWTKRRCGLKKLGMEWK